MSMFNAIQAAFCKALDEKFGSCHWAFSSGGKVEVTDADAFYRTTEGRRRTAKKESWGMGLTASGTTKEGIRAKHSLYGLWDLDRIFRTPPPPECFRIHLCTPDPTGKAI